MVFYPGLCVCEIRASYVDNVFSILFHGYEQATGCSLFDIQYTAKSIYLAYETALLLPNVLKPEGK